MRGSRDFLGPYGLRASYGGLRPQQRRLRLVARNMATGIDSARILCGELRHAYYDGPYREDRDRIVASKCNATKHSTYWFGSPIVCLFGACRELGAADGSSGP